MKRMLSILALSSAILLPLNALAEAEPETPAAPVYAAGEYTAQAKGYAGYVVANVTIDETGKISAVKLEGSHETPDIGGYALEDMPKWFITAQSADVDAYAGATFTRNGIVTAVNDCLSQASGAPSYKPGEYTAQAKGYAGYVVANVTIDESGKISAVKLEGSHETPDIGGYALEDMPKWFITAQSADVDAYAGATFTRNGIVTAVSDCLTQAQP